MLCLLDRGHQGRCVLDREKAVCRTQCAEDVDRGHQGISTGGRCMPLHAMLHLGGVAGRGLPKGGAQLVHLGL